MFFRSSRVYLAQVFPGCQSSGVCVADVQFAAVVLATNPTAGIQSAHHGSSLGAAAADDERDPDLLSGLCGPVSSTRISRVVLTLKEEARLKILAKTRRLRRGLSHQLDHARAP